VATKSRRIQTEPHPSSSVAICQPVLRNGGFVLDRPGWPGTTRHDPLRSDRWSRLADQRPNSRVRILVAEVRHELGDTLREYESGALPVTTGCCVAAARDFGSAKSRLHCPKLCQSPLTRHEGYEKVKRKTVVAARSNVSTSTPMPATRTVRGARGISSSGVGVYMYTSADQNVRSVRCERRLWSLLALLAVDDSTNPMSRHRMPLRRRQPAR
jgi:hypothetical protein